MAIRMQDKLKLMAVPALMTVMIANTMAPAEAHRYYDSRDYRDRGSFSQNHPYLQKAAIGGGAGAIIGGVMGRDGYRADSAMKGALLGAGIGVGYEYLKRQGVFNGGW